MKTQRRGTLLKKKRSQSQQVIPFNILTVKTQGGNHD